jgi:copper ion binding protein
MESKTVAAFDLAIGGMNCASCVGRVERAIRAVPGVSEARVNLATGRAHVEASAAVTPQAVAEAVASAGYEPLAKDVDLDIEGMSCASCVGRVERALAAVPGVQAVSANLATGRARVHGLDGALDVSGLTAAAAAVGYPARPVNVTEPSSAAARTDAEAAALGRAVVIAAALTLPIFVVEMGGHLVPAFHHWLVGTFGQDVLNRVQFVLASLVLLGPGRVFFVKGWPALRRLGPDMNSLVMLGTGAAWAYSTVATFAPGCCPRVRRMSISRRRR